MIYGTKQMTEEIQQQDVVISPGRMLCQAREALNLDETDVAMQLRLSRNVIADIEADNYQRLPANTFTRGYLRAYARLVNISGDEVIERFNQSLVEEDTLTTQTVMVMPRQENERSRHYARWLGYVMAGGLLLLMIVWWHNHRIALQTSINHEVEMSLKESLAPPLMDIAQPSNDDNTVNMAARDTADNDEHGA